MSASRSCHASTVIGKRLFVAGGRSGDKLVTALEVLDLDTWQWQQLKNLPTSRVHPGMAAVDQKVYVFGSWRLETRHARHQSDGEYLDLVCMCVHEKAY